MSLHEEKMSAARAKAVYEAPYFASAIYGFVFQAVAGIKTMLLTKRLILGYDPQWAERATTDALAADIVHEVHHFVRNHFGRAGMIEDPARWNVAADLAINPDLRLGGWKLDESAIFPEDYGLPLFKTAEEYYDLLQQEQQQGGGSQKKEKEKDKGEGGNPAPGGQQGEEGPQEVQGGIAAGHCGGIAGHSHNPDIEAELDQEPGLGRSETEVKAIEKRMAADIKQYAETQGRGKLPGSLLDLIKKFDEESSVRWQDELAQVVRDTTGRMQSGGEDFSRARPSKRSIMRGIVRPSMVEYMPEAAIIRDSSGSMGARQLTVASREAYAILQALGIDEVWFADADTQIASVWNRVGPEFFRNLTDVHGRGGTDFRQPIESALRLHPRPDILFYISDGDGRAPPSPPPGMAVVWCIVESHYNRAPARWGHVVIISDDPKKRNAKILRPDEDDDDDDADADFNDLSDF